MKKGADGSVVAAPIWREFITKALANQKPEEFKKPKGIIEMAVDRVSGKLPTKYTPSTKKEVFASFNVPKDWDNVHLGISTSTASKILPSPIKNVAQNN
jgi:penicillin-binding protein 1A